jgi:hypothetical protein
MKYVTELKEDPATGDALITLTPEILAEVGWVEGDTLSWEVTDGAIHLTKKTPREAIIENDPSAYSIVHHGDDSYSARISSGAIAYYTIKNGKIIGDVWYE